MIFGILVCFLWFYSISNPYILHISNTKWLQLALPKSVSYNYYFSLPVLLTYTQSLYYTQNAVTLLLLCQNPRILWSQIRFLTRIRIFKTSRKVEELRNLELSEFFEIKKPSLFWFRINLFYKITYYLIVPLYNLETDSIRKKNLCVKM